MKRKLIQLSESTSVVSLPSQWVQKNRLKKGVELECTEQENRIVYAVGKDLARESITLDISAADDRMLFIIIDAAYAAGYQEIAVTTRDRKQAALMTKVVHYFPGMIISEERGRTVVFTELAKEEDIDIPKILLRIFHMNMALIDDSLAAVQEKDWPVLVDAKRRDYTINSYVSLCQRTLTKSGYANTRKLGAMKMYIKILEMFSDKLCILLKGLGERKQARRQEMAMLRKLRDVYEEVYRLHHSYSLKRLLELEIRRRSLLSPRDVHNHFATYFTELLELVFELEEIELELHVGE